LFCKQGFVPIFIMILTAYKKSINHTVDAFFMLNVLLSLPLCLLHRQSAKATAGESQMIFIPDPSATDDSTTFYSLFTKFTFFFTIEIPQVENYQSRFA